MFVSRRRERSANIRPRDLRCSSSARSRTASGMVLGRSRRRHPPLSPAPRRAFCSPQSPSRVSVQRRSRIAVRRFSQRSSCGTQRIPRRAWRMPSRRLPESRSQRRRSLPLTIGSELWIKFTDKLSPGFTAGGGGAVNSAIEYKYLFVDVTLPAPDYRTGQFQVELENALSASGTSTAVSDFGLRTKIVDYASKETTSQGRDSPLGSTFAGQWHTWVFGFTGIGSSAVTFVAYLDGNLVQSITGPWFPGKNIAGSILGLQLGANINNGPRSRADRGGSVSFGVYTRMPSLTPAVAAMRHPRVTSASRRSHSSPAVQMSSRPRMQNCRATTSSRHPSATPHRIGTPTRRTSSATSPGRRTTETRSRSGLRAGLTRGGT
jgi:hypothetical protein